MNEALVGPLLHAFFIEHLVRHKNASPQTIASYRDAFRLLLNYVREHKGIAPSSLRIADLDVPVILAFLDNLEQQRNNAIRSRNVRLAAVRSFFRLVALREPTCVEQATRMLAIPVKRCDKRLVGYLTREEIEALLNSTDLSQRMGRRDHALLLTLYNSGARVSEIIGVRRQHLCFGASTVLNLTGKGRKQRAVPLWSRTARVLRSWLNELESGPDTVVFPSARCVPLSRDGVEYILKQAVQRARAGCPGLCDRKVTPHILRHTTAMHLLQSGVDLGVIALWLGHESMETTHIYVEADLAMKEKALEKLTPAGVVKKRFRADDELLGFLGTL